MRTEIGSMRKFNELRGREIRSHKWFTYWLFSAGYQNMCEICVKYSCYLLALRHHKSNTPTMGQTKGKLEEKYHQKVIARNQDTIVTHLSNQQGKFNSVLDHLLAKGKLPCLTHSAFLIQDRDELLSVENKVRSLLRYLYDPIKSNAFDEFCIALDKGGLTDLKAKIRRWYECASFSTIIVMISVKCNKDFYLL